MIYRTGNVYGIYAISIDLSKRFVKRKTAISREKPAKKPM